LSTDTSKTSEARPGSRRRRKEETSDEGQAEREEDLQQVPDHSQAWPGHGYLL
jgi:hypothetical protein